MHTGIENHIGFDGGIAARIDDFAPDDFDDTTHRRLSSKGCCLTAVSIALSVDSKLFHAAERPGVRPVAQRLGGIRMRFHEQAGDAGGDRGARQHRDVFALAAGARALPAR